MHGANPLNLNWLRPAEERYCFMPTHSVYRNLGLVSASMTFADTPVLTVYAPDYFASEWGPGPLIETAFEKECDCDLQFKTGEVLSRIILEGARSEADVVIGLNTDVTKKARETGLFADHGQDFVG